MGATLDETQLELEAQRARVRGTADRLETAVRRSTDIRGLIGRNPARTAALAAGAAFFLLGGPHRTVRFIRRTLRGAADGERAYATLPAALRHLVDETAPGLGDSKVEARRQLALALHAWRADPKNRKKAETLVNEALTPPGPQRAFWALVEVAGVAAASIIAKQVVAPTLARGLATRLFGPPRAPTASAAAQPQTATADPSPGPTSYTGWSGRNASVAGPAREPAPPAAPAKDRA